jgi:hypothetical protein
MRDWGLGFGIWEQECVILWRWESRRRYEEERRRRGKSRLEGRGEPWSTGWTASETALKVSRQGKTWRDWLTRYRPAARALADSPVPPSSPPSSSSSVSVTPSTTTVRPTSFHMVHRARADRCYSLSPVSTLLFTHALSCTTRCHLYYTHRRPANHFFSPLPLLGHMSTSDPRRLVLANPLTHSLRPHFRIPVAVHLKHHKNGHH